MTFQKGHKDFVPISSRRNPKTRKLLSMKAKKRGNSGNGFKKGHKGLIGQDNPIWKGNNAGYVSIHMWVRKWKGKALNCEVCGENGNKKYHWANIDHSYKRVLEDYISMCTSCHGRYDKSLRKLT